MPLKLFIQQLKISFLFVSVFFCIGDSSKLYSQVENKSLQYAIADTLTKATKTNELFRCFDSLSPKDVYSITVCADVPDNSNPSNPVFKNEPGHVFIILTKQENKSGKLPVSISFGFYPRYIAMVLFIKKMPGEIRVSTEREYDVSVTKQLSLSEFRKALFNAELLAQKKYHLNHFNCYDYAVQLFNSVCEKDTLPISRMKFPFTGGSGGSPCCLYKDLDKLKKNKSSLSLDIHFGATKAPATCSISKPSKN